MSIAHNIVLSQSFKTTPLNHTKVSTRRPGVKVYYLYIEEVAQTVMTGHNEYKIMSNDFDAGPKLGHLVIYQIRIKGHLGNQWTDWFGGLAITLEDSGDTLLTGPVVDQAALHGLLKKVRDLGMPLVSVNRLGPSQTCSKVKPWDRSISSEEEKSR